MASHPSVRHVEALVNSILENRDVESLLRRGLESFLSALMEAEVTEVTGAAHGEASGARSTHRNGYREREFQTGLGTSTLRIPKVRQGTYFPSFLTAYKRSDDALTLAVAACYQQGVSTRNVEAIAKALGVEHMKKSQVSDIIRVLDPQVQAFRERKLGECPYVWVDARYEHVREDHRVHKVAVLVAIGVRRDGMREVLGVAVERVENEAFWDAFMERLLARGLSGVKLVISDAHQGLRRAIERRFPTARWQRCRVHFMRNLGERCSPRQRAACLALAKTIFAQENLEDALRQRAAVADALRSARQAKAATFLESTDDMLTYMSFPRDHWSKLHSTNVVERLNRELKRRTRVVSIFPNRQSLIRLAGALLLEEHEEWLIGRRYISERSMTMLFTPMEQLDLSDELMPTLSVEA